jgi:hypothetical protein
MECPRNNFGKMIKFELLVCAETLMRDAEKDAFSAINIMEDFVAEFYPAFIPKFNALLVTSIEDEAPNKIINAKNLLFRKYEIKGDL